MSGCYPVKVRDITRPYHPLAADLSSPPYLPKGARGGQ
jgi:hypothetical protein